MDRITCAFLPPSKMDGLLLIIREAPRTREFLRRMPVSERTITSLIQSRKVKMYAGRYHLTKKGVKYVEELIADHVSLRQSWYEPEDEAGSESKSKD